MSKHFSDEYTLHDVKTMREVVETLRGCDEATLQDLVIHAIHTDKISMSRGAEILNIKTYDMMDLVQEFYDALD